VKHLCLYLVSLLVWSSPSLAAIKEKVVVAANGQKIPVVYVFPDTLDGKIPAMLVMHGSAGPAKREYDYAEKFAKMGVASIVIDSFSPRGIKDVISDQESVRSSEMTLDALAVLQEAAKHPKLDSSRIGIIGFSKGGSVALRAPLNFVNKAGNVQFALYVAMYPSCDSFRLKFTTTGSPIKVLVGEKDVYVNPRACIDLVALYKKDGADIEVTTLPDAEHGWDAVGPRHWKRSGQNYSQCRFVEISPRVWVERKSGIKVEDEKGATAERKKALSQCMTFEVRGGYNPEAAARSFSLIADYVRTILKPGDKS